MTPAIPPYLPGPSAAANLPGRHAAPHGSAVAVAALLALALLVVAILILAWRVAT